MSSVSPPAPRQLGRYQLMFLLGQGGMGEVHLARLTGAAGFEKLCIVKTILPAMQADINFVERFHHEARVLVQLTHSHIAQVYDMGEADGTLYMSIEYVPGVDLSRVLRRVVQAQTAVPVPIAIHLAQQVAEALGYAHRKTGPDGVPLGIVHRDVSPQNVMVSYDGEAKVIDFGLAKSAGRSNRTMPSTVMGKLGYMSPEQALGKPLDSRSDIYSAGIVLWEMLAGRPLFGDGTMAEMVARMAMPEVPSLRTVRPGLSETLDRLVLRTLAVDPSDRFARADEMSRALNEIAVREGLTVGSEEVGNFVRAMCPEEFAAERQLQSKLSQLRRAASPAGLAPPPIEPTSIRSGTKSAQIEGTLVRDSQPLEQTPAQRSLHQAVSPIVLDNVVAQSGASAHAVARSSAEFRVVKSRTPWVVLGGLALAALAGGGWWMARGVKPSAAVEVVSTNDTPKKKTTIETPDPPVQATAEADAGENVAEAEKPANPLISVRPPVYKVVHRNESHYIVLGKQHTLSTGDRLAVVGPPLDDDKREYLGAAAVIEVTGALAEVLMDVAEDSDDEHFVVRETVQAKALQGRRAPVAAAGKKTAVVQPSAAQSDAGVKTEPAPPATTPTEPAMVVQPFPTAPTPPAPSTAPASAAVKQMPTVKAHIDVRRGAFNNYVYLVNDNNFTLSGCYIRLSNSTAFHLPPSQVIRSREFAEIDQKKFRADPSPPTEAMRQGWSLIQCREGDGYVATRFARGQ